jgi:hypothetical protein
MNRVLLCSLSAKRLELLRADPALIPDLRKAIETNTVPGALDLGDLSGARRDRLAARFGEAAYMVRDLLGGEHGAPLGHGARLLSPAEIAKITSSFGAQLSHSSAERSVERVADELRSLLLQAKADGEHVLLIGQSTPAPSELDQRVVRVCLHTSGNGLRHPDEAERRRFFWDLHERLIGPDKLLRPVALDEIRELVLLWAAGGAAFGSRRLAALMLAQLASAVGNGGPVAAAATERMRADLTELGSSLIEIFDEMDEAGRGAMALVCARVRLAEEAIVQRLAEPLRQPVRAAYAGTQAAYPEVIAAIEGAILQPALGSA